MECGCGNDHATAMSRDICPSVGRHHGDVMICIDPRDGSTQDTMKIPWPVLMGLLKFVAFHSGSKRWIEANGGGNILHRFAVAIRVRAQVSQITLASWVIAKLQTIDPAPCRCGRKGTRIIGRVTFCSQCGPTSKLKANLAFHRAKETGYVNDENAETALKRRSANACGDGLAWRGEMRDDHTYCLDPDCDELAAAESTS